ncbi:hypothetical protein CC80DRAFT_530698 [Byssothecium circinans]|uniref:Uncharacterized protein n=1 Tax=Byssothecium circinans TaxID=147558 RepID=A0A6A5UIN4_9PLEO|nr:hypothetical protein CC80DRAFT_530698 [Byssothecium circinans]
MIVGIPWMTAAINNQTYDEPQSGTEWGKSKRIVTAVAVTGALVGGWPIALGALGWSAGGVVAGMYHYSQCLSYRLISDVGSLAAGAQAGIGNVVAGSAFALTQSAAMGGSVAGVVNGAIVGAGGIAAAYEAFKGSDDDQEGKKKEKAKP